MTILEEGHQEHCNRMEGDMACRKIFSMIVIHIIAATVLCGEPRQMITPILSNRFGKLITVKGNVIKPKSVRLKNQDGQNMTISIYYVDGKKINPQTMLLIPGNADIEDSIKSVKKEVKLMGYEIVECAGIPNGMDNPIASESFSINHCFVVTRIY